MPNLARFNDVADYILRGQRVQGANSNDPGAYSSESEIEDLPGSKILLPDDYQDKKKNTNVAIRLHELGPRLKLRLIKIEEGVCRGNIVYHAFQSRTPAEVKKQLDSMKNKRDLKEKRKSQQEENVRKKQEKKEAEAGEDGKEEKKGDGEESGAEGAAAEVDENQDRRARSTTIKGKTSTPATEQAGNPRSKNKREQQGKKMRRPPPSQREEQSAPKGKSPGKPGKSAGKSKAPQG